MKRNSDGNRHVVTFLDIPVDAAHRAQAAAIFSTQVLAGKREQNQVTNVTREIYFRGFCRQITDFRIIHCLAGGRSS